MVDLDVAMTQEAFGALVGVTQQAISAMVADDVLPERATGREWLLTYCARLRDQAAGRASAESLELMRANKLLADEKRKALMLKNAQTERNLAPVVLMTEVLSEVMQSVATHLDAVVPTMMRSGLELTEAQRTAINASIAKARNEIADTDAHSAMLDLIVDGDDDAAATNGADAADAMDESE